MVTEPFTGLKEGLGFRMKKTTERQAHGGKQDTNLDKHSEILEPKGVEMLEDLWRRRGRGEGEAADQLTQI